jgi:hypothetical protein
MSTTTNTEQFTIDVVGDTSGKTFKGLFKTKVRLSHRDQLRMDEVRRDLLGKNPEAAGVRAQNQADVFSLIAVHIIEAPQWWGANGAGLDLEDDNVIAEVYGKIVDVKTEAQKKLKDAAEAASKDLAEAK